MPPTATDTDTATAVEVVERVPAFGASEAKIAEPTLNSLHFKYILAPATCTTTNARSSHSETVHQIFSILPQHAKTSSELLVRSNLPSDLTW